MNQNLKKKALLVVVGAFLLQFFVFNVSANLMGPLQPKILEHFNLTGTLQTKFLLIYTIGVIVPGIASPFIPRLYQKLGFKKTFLLGAVVSAGSFTLMSFIPTANPTISLICFWVLAGLFNLGNAMFSALGIPSLLSQWFTEEEKGRYLGIAFMGSSAGNVVASSILKLINLNAGNVTLVILGFGLVALVVGVIVVLSLIKAPTKQEYTEIHAHTKSEEKNFEVVGLTFNEAVKSPIFYLFLGGLITLGFYVSALSTQYATYISQEINKDLYLSVVPVFAFCSIFGNLIGGYLFDKIKQIPTLIVGLTLVVIAVLSLKFAPGMHNLVFLFAICYGLSVFTYIVLPGYMTGYLFGQKDYNKILGITNMVFALGFAVGILIFGQIVQVYGYATAFNFILVFGIITYTLMIIATIYKIKSKKINY